MANGRPPRMEEPQFSESGVPRQSLTGPQAPSFDTPARRKLEMLPASAA